MMARLPGQLVVAAVLACGPGAQGSEGGASPPPAADGTATRRPATASLADIRARVAAARQRLRSLRVEYESIVSIRQQPPNEAGKIRRAAAAKGVCRYISTLQFVDGKPFEDDPEFAHSFYDGRSWNAYHPYNRIYQTSRRFMDPTHTLKARGEAYFESLGWWPPDDPSDPPSLDGRRFFLNIVLANESCRVRAEQEQVEGLWCHVVEVPGYDRIWLDDDGWVVRRTCYEGDESRLSMHYELSDFRPVSPGVRLPHSVRRVEYSTAERAVLYESRFRVIGCQANSVPDAQFTFTPGPGTLVYDRDTDTAIQVPGGLDFIDQSVARIDQRLSQHAGVRGPAGTTLLAWSALGCLFYLAWQKLASWMRVRHVRASREPAAAPLP
jgi:hypothetical protein